MKRYLSACWMTLGLIVLFVSPHLFAEEPYEVEWVRQFGGTWDTEARSVTIDFHGNAYVTGIVRGSLDGSQAGDSSYNVLLAKYDSAGNQLWAEQFNSVDDGYDSGLSVAADHLGNAYVAGRTTGSFGGVHINGSGSYDSKWDAFLAKDDAAGNQQWAAQLGTEYWDGIYSISVDSYGSAYVLGLTEGQIGETHYGGSDLFLAKYDTVGDQCWVRQMGTDSWEFPADIAVDHKGDVIIHGYAEWVVLEDLISSGEPFWAKYDSEGNPIWFTYYGTLYYEYSEAMTVDATGNIYSSGMDAYQGAYLTKHNSAGELLWSKFIDAGSVRSMATDDSGGLFLSGSRYGGERRDAFIAKYDLEGNLLWEQGFDTGMEDESYSLAIDGQGDPYLAGYTYGDFIGTDSPNYHTDAFVIKLSTPEPGSIVLLLMGSLVVGNRNKYRAGFNLP